MDFETAPGADSSAGRHDDLQRINRIDILPANTLCGTSRWWARRTAQGSATAPDQQYRPLARRTQALPLSAVELTPAALASATVNGRSFNCGGTREVGATREGCTVTVSRPTQAANASVGGKRVYQRAVMDPLGARQVRVRLMGTRNMPTWPIPSLKELLEPTLNHMGYDLYAIDQSGHSGRTLRISIDHTEPITIDDCERVSRVAGPLIDHSNLIDGPYELEVSSPGAERPLRNQHDYERFNGKRVNIRYRSGETETVVEGQLVAVDAAGIAVQAQAQRGRAPVIVHIGWDDVVAGRLAVSI